MAGLVQHKSFTVLASDAVNATHVVTFDFQPVAIILIWSDRAGGNALGRATMQLGKGFAVSPTSRRAWVIRSTDAVPTTDGRAGMRDCAVLRWHPTASISDGRLDYDAVLATGARFIVDEVFGADTRIDVIGLGGSFLAEIGDIILPDTGDPTATISGLGFQPECVLFGGIGNDTVPIHDSASAAHVFAGMVSTAEQFCHGLATNGAAAPNSETTRFERYGDIACGRTRGGGGVRGVFDFNAFTSDGFVVNVTQDNDDAYPFLALRGGSFAIEEFVTKTDGADIVIPVGFRASGGIIVSHHTTESVDDDTTQVTLLGSHGVFSSPTERGCHFVYDEDSEPTMRTASGLRNDSVYARMTQAASPVVAGLGDIKQIDPTDVVLVMDDPDPDAAHGVLIAFGPTATAALTGSVLPTLLESEVVSGGKTIILTLTDDAWVAAGGTFDAVRQDIIDGLLSDGVEAAGWNVEVVAAIPVGNVVRTSDTVVTITLPAVGAYVITANETIEATIDAGALVDTVQPLVAPETFTVTDEPAPPMPTMDFRRRRSIVAALGGGPGSEADQE